MNVTGYERLKAALLHKESDRIPFDIGGTVQTGINKHSYKKLRTHLGLDTDNIKVCDTIQQLAFVDDDLVNKLNIDVRYVGPGESRKKGLAKDIVIEDNYYKLVDEFGIGWKMPIKGGHYFDMTSHPLQNTETIEDIKKYQWPDRDDINIYSKLKEQADKYVIQDKKAYVLGRPDSGIWETALFTNGYEKFFMDMLLNKKYCHALMEQITEHKMKYWEKALEAVGENVLVIAEADDLATQSSLLCSVDTYKEMVHPYHKILFDYIKSKAKNDVHIFYHSCGAVKPLIPLLIEEGVDILNPVQVNASDMDTKVLKREYGKDITFWGGGIDTQKTLPFGTPKEVREETKRRIEDLSKDGGFVFAAVHNVQSDVPPENIVAMWKTVMEYGKY